MLIGGGERLTSRPYGSIVHPCNRFPKIVPDRGYIPIWGVI